MIKKTKTLLVFLNPGFRLPSKKWLVLSWYSYPHVTYSSIWGPFRGTALFYYFCPEENVGIDELFIVFNTYLLAHQVCS
jgi:hypothetical protein